MGFEKATDRNRPPNPLKVRGSDFRDNSVGDDKCAVRRVALWTVLVGASLRLIFFVLSVNNGGDALARVEETAKWLEHPNLQFTFGPWLPLHFWLMGGLAVLLGDVATAGRLLSLCMGVASLWLLWGLAREIYGDGKAATLSLTIFAFYSLHISYSTTSSSEVPYLFFVLAALTSFFVYRRSGRLRWLILSGICLTLGAAIRYEAWGIILATILLLLGPPWSLSQRGFRKRFYALGTFVLSAGAWPVFSMIYSWLKFGHPLYPVAMNRVWVAEQLAFSPKSELYRVALTPGVILLTLTPLALAASLYTLWLASRERTGRPFLTVVAITALVHFYQITSGGVMAFARYTLTLGTLLAIMSGYGLKRIEDRFFAQAPGRFRAAVVATLVVNLAVVLALSETRHRYSEKFSSISPRLRFARYIEDVGSYLRPRLGAHDAMVIDDYNVESNVVAAAAGLPLLRGDRAFLASSRSGSELLPYFEAKHPRYVVYSDRGTLRPYLPLPRKCSNPASFAGMWFRCVFENEIYRIYEVEYR